MKLLTVRRWQGVAVVGLSLGCLWGCGSNTVQEGTTSGSSTTSSVATSGGGRAADPAAPLFASDTVATFAIKLSQKDIDALNADPKKYVKGDVDVTVGGQTITLPSVGVRLKGNYGSLRTLDQKAAFLLKFDKYTSDQNLFGLTKLALNNMVQDASMMRERIGYRLFREGDVPAPRAAYATVTVNGAPYGLYTSVESTSNAEFLSRWFGGDTGNLYEGSYGSDLEFGWLDTFDQDNGTDVSLADLQELASALDGMVNPETFVEEVSKVIDLDRYLAFAATELYLGHWDGYVWTRNNYYIYRRPDDGRWTWIPWGIDQTLDRYLDIWGGDSRLQRMCDASAPCQAKLVEAFKKVLALAEQLEIAKEATDTKGFIWDLATQDPRKEAGMVTVATTIDKNIEFLTRRPADVQRQITCAEKGTVDADGDGYSGCGSDCNDSDPKVHPGAAEACNLADDDCDGVWDNNPTCSQCLTQPLPSGGKLAVCFSPKTWSAAEADCVAQGGHLASIHDQETQDLLTAQATSVGVTDWWIGLNDRASEGMFTWTDKTPVDFTRWASGEPNNAGGGENCVHLNAWDLSSWNDNNCGNAFKYICQLP